MSIPRSVSDDCLIDDSQFGIGSQDLAECGTDKAEQLALGQSMLRLSSGELECLGTTRHEQVELMGRRVSAGPPSLAELGTSEDEQAQLFEKLEAAQRATSDLATQCKTSVAEQARFLEQFAQQVLATDSIADERGDEYWSNALSDGGSEAGNLDGAALSEADSVHGLAAEAPVPEPEVWGDDEKVFQEMFGSQVSEGSPPPSPRLPVGLSPGSSFVASPFNPADAELLGEPTEPEEDAQGPSESVATPLVRRTLFPTLSPHERFAATVDNTLEVEVASSMKMRADMNGSAPKMQQSLREYNGKRKRTDIVEYVE